MITSVSIENLRGIREGKLEGLTPLTVLVGPNSSGKSTVLDALLIGGHPVLSEAVGQVVKRRGAVKQGLRWLLWRSRESEQATIKIATDQHSKRTCTLRVTDTRVAVGVLANNASMGAELTFHGNTFASGQTGALGRLPDLATMRLVEPRGGVEPPPLHRVWSRARAEGRIKDVDALLRELIPGLDRVEILTDGDEPVVSLGYADHAVPSGLAGDGVQSLLRLALELAATDGGVVLIEEPETHEHPGAIRQSARAIVAAVKRGIQVVLSTHSLELVDSLIEALNADDIGVLSLYRLKLVDGVLRSSRLDGEDVSMSRGEIGDDLR